MSQSWKTHHYTFTFVRSILTLTVTLITPLISNFLKKRAG